MAMLGIPKEEMIHLTEDTAGSVKAGTLVYFEDLIVDRQTGEDTSELFKAYAVITHRGPIPNSWFMTIASRYDRHSNNIPEEFHLLENSAPPVNALLMLDRMAHTWIVDPDRAWDILDIEREPLCDCGISEQDEEPPVPNNFLKDLFDGKFDDDDAVSDTDLAGMTHEIPEPKSARDV